jgi:uncharacterized membrane protein
MAVLDTAEDFRIGRVVSRLFNALFANSATFLTLAALLMIPVLLLTFYTSANYASMGITAAGGLAPGAGWSFFRLLLLQMTIYIVFSYLLQAALVQGTISYLNDERSSLGQCLSSALKSVVPLAIIALLSLLGMFAGMMLLLVPGLILALMWSVVVPVRMVENTGITETFGRSRALTKGYRGKIFLLILMYMALALAIAFVTRPLLGVSLLAKPAELNVPYIVVGWVEQVVLAAITAAGIASVYYELRLVKEGIGAQQMAAAFD